MSALASPVRVITKLRHLDPHKRHAIGRRLGQAWAWSATFGQLDFLKTRRRDLLDAAHGDPFRSGLITGALDEIDEIEGEPCASLPPSRIDDVSHVHLTPGGLTYAGS